MFESLTEKLESAFKQIKGEGRITELNIASTVKDIRRAKGMLIVPGDPDTRSAGSFFKNPVVPEAVFQNLESREGPGIPHFPAPAGSVKIPAAWLIERAGFARGYAKGGAAISSRHTLAITNHDNATAKETAGQLAEAEAERAELIGQIELRVVDNRNTLH